MSLELLTDEDLRKSSADCFTVAARLGCDGRLYVLGGCESWWEDEAAGRGDWVYTYEIHCLRPDGLRPGDTWRGAGKDEGLFRVDVDRDKIDKAVLDGLRRLDELAQGALALEAL